MANERQIKLAIVENADKMAKALLKGKDLEVRKSVNGISIAEVDKKVVVR